MADLRIAFIGCVEFSAKALTALIKAGFSPVCVMTKNKSGFNADFVDLAPIASDCSIPYKYVNDINDPANVHWLREFRPDVVFCFGWSSLIKGDILSIAPLGVVGYHPALLPFNRGRHPIIWALALGLKETGSSFFFMDTGADTGDILSQKKVEISSSDNARTLYDKIVATALSQILEMVPELKDGTYKRVPQSILSGNSWRKRSKTDGQIDFRMATHDIVNLAKALYRPYVGAHIVTLHGDAIVWEVADGGQAPGNIEPGKVLEIKGKTFRVKSGNGSVWVLDHELKEIPAEGDYLI